MHPTPPALVIMISYAEHFKLCILNIAARGPQPFTRYRRCEVGDMSADTRGSRSNRDAAGTYQVRGIPTRNECNKHRMMVLLCVQPNMRPAAL